MIDDIMIEVETLPNPTEQMYDNVFLKGHVSCEGDDAAARMRANQNQFVPGYLAMFL